MKAFDKVIGYDDVKAELIRFADVIKNTEKYLKLGVTLPSGLLLYGKPGLGKTLMANCFIAETGCKVFLYRHVNSMLKIKTADGLYYINSADEDEVKSCYDHIVNR